jgi:broad-specificity NMP kinase
VLSFESEAYLEEVLHAAGLAEKFLLVRLSPTSIAILREDLTMVEQELQLRGYHPTRVKRKK